MTQQFFGTRVTPVYQRKVFVDIGAHLGQTLMEACKDKYAFDKIYAFEPLPLVYDALINVEMPLWQPDSEYSRIRSNPNIVEIFNYGLLNVSEKKILHGSSRSIGASIYSERTPAHKIEGDSDDSILCEFVKASEFFSTHLSYSDLVVVKLNVEGSETHIINDLLDSGEMWKISHALIDFDSVKFVGHERDGEEIIEKFRRLNFTNFTLTDQILFENGELLYAGLADGHQKRIAHWLLSLPCFKSLT